MKINNMTDNIFDGVYEIRASKVIGIIISVVNLSIITPGVNIINNLQAAFTHVDPKSAKRTVKLSVFIAL